MCCNPTRRQLRALISFSEISLETEWGSLRADGDAYLRSFRDGLPRALLAQFQFRDVEVNPPGFYEAPPEVPLVAVDLRLQFDPFRVEFGQVVVVDGPTRLTAHGDVTATDAGWSLALDAAIEQIAPERFASFWPLSMKPGTRDWVARNLTDGRLFNVVAGFRKRPEQAMQTALSFEFDDMAIRFMRQMPPIRRAAGVASIQNSSLVASLDAGVVTAPTGGPMQLAGSSFTILDMRQKPSTAVLDIAVSSSVTAGLSILNQPPFSYLDKANLPVTIADGRAVTRGQMTWLLQRPVPPGSLQFEISSDVRNVRSDRLIPDRSLSASRLEVTVSRAGLNIAGPARIGGVAAVGNWDLRFGDPERPGSQVQAAVALSPAPLDRCR